MRSFVSLLPKSILRLEAWTVSATMEIMYYVVLDLAT